MAAVVLFAGLGVTAYFVWFRTKLPDYGSPKYIKYVNAFNVGVAALDLGEPKPPPSESGGPAESDLAFEKLTEAVETVPEEPAGWADRGLWYLRNTRLDKAAADLGRAERLAPDSPQIQQMLGLLAKQQGKYHEAVNYLRKVLEAEPKNLLTLYTLAQMLETEAAEGSDAEVLKLLDAGLAVQPYNLRLLREKTIVAARLGDGAAVAQTLAAYESLAPSWTSEYAGQAQAQLKTLEEEARGPLPGGVPDVAGILDNFLKPEHNYARDVSAVDRDDKNLGEALQQFLRLRPMRAAPAEPDLELAFDPAVPAGRVAESVAGSRWDVALPVWLTQDGEPVVFVANAKEVRPAILGDPRLPFPGGPRAVAPTADGVVPVDWNNDYRTHLLFAGAGGLRFFQQVDESRFADVTPYAGLDPETLSGNYYGAWAADYDMDGDLDLIVAPRAGPPLVLRNNGQDRRWQCASTFGLLAAPCANGPLLAAAASSLATASYKVMKPFPGVDGARAFVWADFDNDGAPDAAFLDKQGKPHVFANERAGQFRERAMPDGLGKYLAIAAADVNDDGVIDLIALRDDGVVQRFSDKDKGAGWDVAELARWPEFPAGGEVGAYRLIFADLDNNGGMDLIVAGPEGARVWLCDERRKLSPLAASISERVFAAVDLTRDGRLDLLALSGSGQPLQRVNRGKKDYHWQLIRPKSVDRRSVDVKPQGRVNSYGIGGEVEIRAGLLVQKQLITSPVLHFGLGDQPNATVARLLWTNGGAQAEYDLAADQSVAVEQRLFGSCPFLFTWNGDRMEFVTDILWSSPLGLYINAQDRGGIAQTTDWVKVRGDQLKPRDGFYDVRITADLWETHYFDHVHLTVVDHPADTEMFVDERFFLTPTAPQLYLTKPPRPVARATDDNGDDVTEIVRRVDGRYLDTFGRGKYQGVTRDHFVEVDLGDDAPKTGPVYLLATGWIHPTDSSINAAIEQGSNDRPHGLVLEVPDGKGGWTVGRPALGFPAGKNKTIVIRLDDPHPTLPHPRGEGREGGGVARRFRLRTNMEIYWDALEYAEGLDAGQVRQTILQPDTAQLRHRGISRITRADDSSPELPDYDKLATRGQYWRDLIGYYTRYGDVRELLDKIDDRYVIMNAGDEMALKFRVPDGPPPGWKRDFVWVSDGWEKDGDFNTRFSKTVLPLPYHGMAAYDTPPGRLADDPAYRRHPDDWKKYHTRYVTPEVFERGLRPWLPGRP